MDHDQKVTPFEVKSNKSFDYMKLINKFGSDAIDGELIKRFEQVTNCKAHTWLRRGIFFSHKDLDKILDDYENNKPIYIYTGRGPSSESMHLGHLVPFIFTKYLQEAFNAIVVIQMSDDEKFIFKGEKKIEEYNRLTYENAKDIIACGFQLEKTYIFSNIKAMNGDMYENVVKLSKVTGNQIRGTYGMGLDNNIGQLMWPIFQCAPAFSNSFPGILHPKGKYIENPDGSKTYVGKHIRCLVPMAIDQAPYFRMARDFSHKYKKQNYITPATIHSKFLIGLDGVNSKMSSTCCNSNYTIFMTDTVKTIKKKLNKHGFSGGKDTVEEHRELGGDINVDVAFQYLCYFLDDDEQLETIAHEYSSGSMLTGELKKITIGVVTEIVQKHQELRKQITPEILKSYFNKDREFDLTRTEKVKVKVKVNDSYDNFGINFDLTFSKKI
jgi:tryptophanyl-tRNA synthetase